MKYAAMSIMLLAGNEILSLFALSLMMVTFLYDILKERSER